MKYEVGDIVRVINKELLTHNSIGKIVAIDSKWDYPYEVEFNKLVEYGEELFSESDIAKLDEEDLEVYKDEEKNPKDFIDIVFQEGTVDDNGVNGAQIEDVIDVLIDRLMGFQKGKFPCRENALAITKLEEARMWLNERTRKRKEQGVEGEHKSHE